MMDQRFRFRFHSHALSAYLVVSGISFCILLFVLWNVTVKMDQSEILERNMDFIINGIKTSLLESIELNSQGIQDKYLFLLQKHLDYTFEKSRISSSSDQFAKASVYFLNPERQLVGEWVNPKIFAKECLNQTEEYFEPAQSNRLYVIEITTNSCSSHTYGLFEYHVLSAPILVAFCIVGLWGICIYMMFDSVNYAGKLLSIHENTDEVIENTRQIRWKNVATLTQKALVVRGRNLQYYQTLILDTQHDVAKILDLIDKKYVDKELKQNVGMIRGLIQKLVSEVRSYREPNQDVTTNREISRDELIKVMKTYFPKVELDDRLPCSLFVFVSDIFLFERILVNLSSNAIKHSLSIKKISLYFEQSHLCVRVFSLASRLEALKLHFAKATHRIDITNPDTPVYIKIFGRTGRGLSIVKRAAIKLGGKMFFSVSKRVVRVGFDLPAVVREEVFHVNEMPLNRKKVIYFEQEDFQRIAIEQGLEGYMVSKKELDALISMENRLEVVADVELDSHSHVTLKLVSKKERIKGIAYNWLKDVSL